MPTYRDAFLSHAHADNAACADIAARLQALGIDVWIDLHSLQDGHFLGQDIQDELQRRRALLLMMTPIALASFWVQLERDAFLGLMARDRTRMLLPVRLAPCEVPPFMNALKWIDAVGKPRDQVAGEIAAALQTDRNAASPAVLLPRLASLGFTVRAGRAAPCIVPPTCRVPAGPFGMGTQGDLGNEPWHTVTLGAFAIGAYPVTVAEYACAVRAGAVPAPAGWAEQTGGKQDHPVVNVSWLDAVAYAAWLAALTGEPWRLPTEAEWEKAARGTDGRRFPWGNAWDPARANTAEQGRNATMPVGTYSDRGDASPYGGHDLAGNVWEWTSSIWRADAYQPDVARENGRDRTAWRVLRGGSWNDGAVVAHAAFRNLSDPAFVAGVWGFRLARG